MFGLGMPELVVILIIALLIFGVGRISEIGGAIGKGIRSFKKSVNELEEIDATPPSKSEESQKENK